MQPSDCDDGAYCNGAETCSAGTCMAGTAPCDEACNEATDTCMATECDADGDGIDSVGCGGSDCDDTDETRFPGAIELCDASHDEDCDPATVGVDRDGDDFSSVDCCNGTSCGLDCDDTLRGVFPGATETCNGRDDDCDGETDEGVLRMFFPDLDGDGFGDRDATPTLACQPPTADHVEDARDCDDDEVLANPSTSEGCDGIDNDCDGDTDEAGSVRWYRDSDGDTFGDANDFVDVVGCAPQAGRVLSSTDCDDSVDETHPGADEACDRTDSDCSYVPDRGGEDPGEDRDQDGHASMGSLCTGGFPADDCDDNDADAFPGNAERCTGHDQDCDGETDEGGAAFCGVGMACDGTCVSQRGLDGWNGSQTFVLTGPFEGFGVDHHAFRFCSLREGVPYCWGNPCLNGNSFSPNCESTLLPAGQAPLQATAVTGLPGLAEEVATGLSHACVRVDGRVLCWGSNADGELGDGTTTASATPVRAQLPADDAVALSAGDGFTCAIRRNRSVWCWGTGEHAAVGTSVSRSTVPVVVPNVSDAIAITSGRWHTCVRHADEGVSCWGDNTQGQAGAASAEFILAARVVGLTGVRAISASIESTCALRDTGAIQCFGNAPEGDPMSTEIDAIGVSQSCMAGVRTDGGVEVFGRTTLGCRAQSVYDGDFEDTTPNQTLAGVSAIEAEGSRKVLCARDEDEDVRCWGLFDGRFAGFVPSTMEGFVEVSTGFNHTCARTAGGRVWCVGKIAFDKHPEPYDMGLSGVTAIATAGWMSCALMADGTLQCWGEGSITTGPTSGYARAPVALGDVGEAVEVALDGAESRNSTGCVRRSDDSIFCWGDNFHGMGDITLPMDVTPTQITVADVGGCATLEGGEVACWGQGPYVPVGGNRTIAVLVPGITDATQVAAGDEHVCVLHSGGTVSCWGENDAYQLGDDTTASNSTPQAVAGLSDVVQIAAAGTSTCARRSNGDVWCWGTHTRWQNPPFGTMTLESSIAARVLGVTGATDIAGGWNGACALSAGRVYCMGRNNEERFGLGAMPSVVFP